MRLAAPLSGQLVSATSTPVRATPQVVASGRRRRRFRVSGVVQGVGFRPFVYVAATSLGLSGTVTNDADGVSVDAQGDAAALDELGRLLRESPPPLAHVVRVETEELEPDGAAGFTIEPSVPGERSRTFCAADVTPCADCLRDLADPTDRRYRHPFVTCTNCGPRFTIVTALPYDRQSTTMADFAMCPACRAEYEDPGARRFHAQPISCHDCGPVLELVDPGHPAQAREPALQGARAVLRSGRVLAVKGLGGYHLVCEAADESAVAELRRRKHRGAKPFALLVPDLATAREIAGVDGDEERVLTSVQRPIVLLARRPEAAARMVADSVAPGAPELGVMLPSTPLHQLPFGLAGDEPGPRVLVMTSGNLGGEPICFGDDDATRRLSGLADAWLRHDRAIVTPCDDSVVRVVDGLEVMVRRSRGYAPLPLTLPVSVPPMLAVGADLKSVCGVAEGRTVWLSQHIGDLAALDTVVAFDAVQERLRRLAGVSPELLVTDAHPGYRSTRWAQGHAGALPVIAGQHHHAHVAAVMAEHGLDGSSPVIGVAFDGTGYAANADSGRAESWGGEVLVADYRDFRRVAHLGYVAQAGGDLSVARPYRMALSQLFAAGVEWHDDLPAVAACPPAERSVLRHQLETGLACTPTSSMGRLFDAVASLIGLRHVVDHEAQAATELEALARHADPVEADATYAFGAGQGSEGAFDAGPVIRAVVADVRARTERAVIAARFHRAVADVVVATCRSERELSGLDIVALGGGVFANVVLLRTTRRLLEGVGFQVLVASRLPSNDGGLALGQIMIAAHQEVACA
ncbi:carbamoyltransferase HypF [soil metagenome]